MIVTGVTGATRESEFEPKATQRVTIRRENTEEKRRRNARKRKSEGGREEHKVKSLKKTSPGMDGCAAAAGSIFAILT